MSPTATNSDYSDIADQAVGGRKLIAVVYADMVGYSRLIGLDDAGTLGRLKALRAQLIDPTIAAHGGRIVQTGGDSLLIAFDSIDGAVRWAVQLQRQVPTYDGDQPPDRAIRFRIGINIGDAIPDGTDLHGEVVNVAARLQAECPPAAICVSRSVHDHVHDRLGLTFELLGALNLKNIARPVEAFVLRSGAATQAAVAPTFAHSSLDPQAARPMLSLPDRPSIAVMPFQSMSGDPEQEYFAEGIAEDVITLLSKSRGLFVIARNSTFTYKSRAIDVKTVGHELGVRYVLEGSVRKAGTRVRVTAQLIETTTGGHLWAERYDRDLTDIFAVQDEITASVSTAILPAMDRSERERVARKPPDSLDAWECYHRGMWHYAKIEPHENALAQGFFKRAIAFDPGFAAAQAAMAVAIVFDARLFPPTDERHDLIARAAEHARCGLALDPTDALGHGTMALVLLLMGRHSEAMTEADLAVSLDPNSALAHAYQGGTRTFGGRPREAIEPLKIAMRLSPFDPSMPTFLHWLGRASYWMGDYPAAVATSRRVCQSYPNFELAYRTLVAGLGQTGQADEAQRVTADALQRFGEEFRSRFLEIRTEERAEDAEHLRDGYRKAGVIKD